MFYVPCSLDSGAKGLWALVVDSGVVGRKVSRGEKMLYSGFWDRPRVVNHRVSGLVGLNVSRGWKMHYSGTDPESHITEYTSAYEEYSVGSRNIPRVPILRTRLVL